MLGSLERRLLVGAIVLVLAAVTILVLVGGQPPTIPANAAAVPVATTFLTGEIAPDLPADGDPAEGPRSPLGEACLDRIQRGSAWLDLCWDANRHPSDADPASDYYILRYRGSFGGEEGGGPRWVVIRTQLAGGGADNVFGAWPEGTVDGDCRQVDVTLLGPTEPLPPEELCGRTAGVSDSATGTHVVTWTCTSCLFPDATTRAIALYNFVAVPANVIPSWDLFADAGT